MNSGRMIYKISEEMQTWYGKKGGLAFWPLLLSNFIFNLLNNCFIIPFNVRI